MPANERARHFKFRSRKLRNTPTIANGKYYGFISGEDGRITMDARAIGIRLVELAGAKQDLKAVEEPYAKNIVSVEIMSEPNEEPQKG